MSVKIVYENGLPCIEGTIVHEGVAAPMTPEERAVLEAAETWAECRSLNRICTRAGTESFSRAIDRLADAVVRMLKARGGA